MSDVLHAVIIIPKKNQYFVGSDKYFKFKAVSNMKRTIVHRDVFCQLSKNSVSILRILASIACVKGGSVLKKAELAKILNQIIIFE